MGDETLRIHNQVFAQVTQIDNFATCEEEEGILGLANALTTSHEFPSLLSNLLDSENILKHNMFGMYLQSQDDYPTENMQRNNDNTSDNEPTSATSQLTLGGVDQRQYLGCLQWHNMLTSVSQDDDGNGDQSVTAARADSNYWSLPLDAVKVGGQTMDSPTGNAPLLAVLDSGSSYLVGPQAAVAKIAKMNGAKCFTLANFDGASPKQVDCLQDDGFDGAILSSCNDPFFNLEFVISGITYVLEKEDLMVTIETLFGEACILRMVGASGMEVSVVAAERISGSTK